MFTLSTLLASLLLLTETNAHGRLTVPNTRKPTGYENDPVSGYTGDDFVCRNPLTTSLTTVQAGSKLTLRWDFGAAHVGDCAVFISYDYNEANFANMKFFKIANLPFCRLQTGQDVEIDLPDWLPGGQAVIRWDWYALHVYPTVEFYAQCVDATIVATASAVSESSLTQYSITSPPVYPSNGNDGIGYRNPYDNGEQYMTGPPCANGFSGNNCALTGPGTTGFIDVNDNTPVQTPTPRPTPGPTDAQPNPTPNPTPGPTDAQQNPTPRPTALPTLSPTSSPTVVQQNPTPRPTPGPTDMQATPTERPTVQPGQDGCQVYTVESGDSLSSIATGFTNAGKSVTWELVCDYNLLEDCQALNVGDVLAIPCSGCGSFVRETEVRHVYGRGIDVVVKNRCVDDAALVTGAFASENLKDEPATTGSANLGAEEGGESAPVSTTMLLVLVGLFTAGTFVVSLAVCMRQRSIERKRLSLENLGLQRRTTLNMNKQTSDPKLPTAPVPNATSGHRPKPPPRAPAFRGKEASWRV